VPRRLGCVSLARSKLPQQSRRYRLLPNGYSICLVFLKLFERVYAPLTAGLLSPPSSPIKDARSSTAFTNASPMTSTCSFELSDSKPHDT
jgi:hypothetical protein